ncbi:hypothetical protein [Emticicia sp.]|uniref:hypothetical protein n=1 Tax=Emticicia sp. TaxID=1930953 RepID=UPI0037509E2D
MNFSTQQIQYHSPFKMFIIHEQGSVTQSNKLPIAIRGRTKLPNMAWAIKTLLNYRIATVKKAIFYEDGIEFGTFENGRYSGKYQVFD